MATTGRSSGSSSVLSPHNHNHHHQRSASSNRNLNLHLRFSPGNTTSKSSVAVSNQKRKCSCSPTTHPGSFRCAFHRRLEIEKSKSLNSPNKRNSNSGLNLRKFALVNSLARFGGVEAERFSRCLTASIVKPSFLDIGFQSEFRPRLSRFHALHKDQD